MAPPPSTPPYQHFGLLAVQVAWCVPLKPFLNVMFCTTICGYGWLTQSLVDHVPAQVSENRIRRWPPPLSVTRPPPSSTTRCLVLDTRAVAVIKIVTGFLPQSNLMIPPLKTARTTAADVQLAGLPSPITWFGWLVLTALPAGGTGKCPWGLPKRGGAAGRSTAGRALAAALASAAAVGALWAPGAIAPARPPIPAKAASKIPKRRVCRTAP